MMPEEVELLFVSDSLMLTRFLQPGNFIAKAGLEFIGVKFGVARRQLVGELP